jgi:hypothetical protein
MRCWIQKLYGVAVLAIVLFELHLTAQEWAWAKRYGGQGAERSTGIVLDTQGNQYAAGWFEGAATFGTQTLIVTGQRDAFVGKWDTSGNLIWVQKAGGKDEDYASAITVDPAGNPILMGTFRSASAEFGGIVISNKYARDYDSLFIAKLDPLGKGIWVQQVGGGSTYYDMASIQTDAQGNIYLVACMARFANFGVTNTNNLSGYEDILVAKYDADGHLAWAKQAGGNGYDYGQSLAVTPDGFAYVTGTFEKSAPFDQLTLTSRGGNDLFLAKYAPDGSLVWVTQAGGSAHDGNGVLALDPEGGVFLSGFFTGSATFGTNVLTSKASTYDQDVFFARYDGQGNVRWVQQIGYTNIDMDTPGSVAVNVTSDGQRYYTNVFLSGHFSYFTTVGIETFTNNTAQRMYLTKWDVDGHVLWARQAGGDNSVIACHGSPNPSVYITGQFKDPSAWNTTWLLSSGNSDVFLARLDSAAQTATPSKPAILQPPQSVSAAKGSAAQLEVQIAGTAPVAYRWRKNGVALNDYSRVFGSATARLNINSIQTNDAGNYTVVVTNSYGSVTSAVAGVTIIPAIPASGPNWNWVRSIGGDGSDSISGLASDGSGNVYVTGYFQNTNVMGTNTLVAPQYAQNIFVAKYDAKGLIQWARQAGGTKYDTPTGIVSDSQGNVYITGYFSSSNAAFGPYILTNQTANSEDLFLAKYDNKGSVLWALSAGGTRDDESRAMTIDADDNLLIVGNFDSSTINLGGLVITNIGGTDILVAKFNPQGQLLWARTAGYSGSHEGNAVAVDAARNVYIAGEIWIRIRFGQIELDTHFDHDTFLAKYNANGELQWARQLNAFSIAIARNLAVDANGDVIMSGYFDQTCDFDNLMVVAHGGHDVFLAKFNPSGNAIWAESLGGPGMDIPRSLTVDAARNIYLTGSFEQTADFGGVTLTTSGKRNVFIVACDPSGRVSWAKQVGGTDGYAIAISAANEVLVGGTFSSSANFDAASYTSSGSSDGFVAQLMPLPTAASVSLRSLRPGNQLEISGTVGKTVILQETADLRWPINWQPLTNFVLATSPVLWTNSQPSLTQQRFYRAVIQP